MPDNSLREIIAAADMVLIGVGEEFDALRSLNRIKGYSDFRSGLKNSDISWLLPKFDDVYRNKLQSRSGEVLSRLAELLQNKNYFVISTSMNTDIYRVSWKDKRLVMPLGGCVMKQCGNGCAGSLDSLTDSDNELLNEFVEGFDLTENVNNQKKTVDIGKCPMCGAGNILNNIYALHYDENGYLEQWRAYTKWLQGTLNRRLILLELGAGFNHPEIIRFPFEKIALYNNKAVLYRVNEKLYQLPVELGEKGNSIAENSIDWLDIMC
ncbi:MAG: hypothetical protein LUG83_08125 [Lachnospiraceae bacterium]|nr:hypothetical protein [Lachnospiraceae bacterium]